MPTPALTPVLWLDPFRRLLTDEQARLGAAALTPCIIRTQDELQAALPAHYVAAAQVLVLGLGSDIELLNDTRDLLQQLEHPLPIICRVERPHLELAVSALRQGACHVLAADDWSLQSWQAALLCAQQSAAPRNFKTHPPHNDSSTPTDAGTAHITSSPSLHTAAIAQPVKAASEGAVRSVVYVDPVSRNLLALAQRVAQVNVSVLLEGPTGSGKEVLARVLHESSSTASGPFVGLNCAALPEHMIEDMLFGHDKGAFTGAIKEHRGLFEQAQGGTLFLDEIAELPLSLQAKLLRVLQERCMTRLGSERTISLNLRVIAATNKDLRQAIVQREFREDLYFRLSTFKLRIPPLAQRKGDIFPLVLRLLARYQTNGQAWQVSEQAQAQLLDHGWPGNVRELENVVQRAMVLCPDQKIDSQHLLFDDMPETPLYSGVLPQSWAQTETKQTLSPAPALSAANSPEAGQGKRLQAAVKQSEQHVIRAALENSESKIEAAQKLGISPRTLRYKLARLRETSLALELSA